MKNYKERTEYIINEINRRNEKKRKKRAAIECFSALAVCLCFTVILSCYIFRQLGSIKKTPLMKINYDAVSELPDPYSVNDISAYVSQVIEIASASGVYTHVKSPDSEINTPAAYIPDTGTRPFVTSNPETNLSDVLPTAETEKSNVSFIKSTDMTALQTEPGT